MKIRIDAHSPPLGEVGRGRGRVGKLSRDGFQLGNNPIKRERNTTNGEMLGTWNLLLSVLMIDLFQRSLDLAA
jgi:hypothetical protein